LGIDSKHTECLKLAGRLLGFNDWYDFIRRNLDAPLSALDEQLSDAEFAARDEFQMAVLAAAGLGPVARELLDRANPTGSWSRTPAEMAER
jgi:glutathione S-transferase